jgi:hypothetical protein
MPRLFLRFRNNEFLAADAGSVEEIVHNLRAVADELEKADLAGRRGSCDSSNTVCLLSLGKTSGPISELASLAPRER